jgi:putative addiction module killer protein
MILIKHRIVEALSSKDRNPFRIWLRSLSDLVAARVQARLYAVELGKLGDHKSVGSGICELRLHFGPGYRIYFAREGPLVIVLLGGGDKGSQGRDIKKAKVLWQQYKGAKYGQKKR